MVMQEDFFYRLHPKVIFSVYSHLGVPQLYPIKLLSKTAWGNLSRTGWDTPMSRTEWGITLRESRNGWGTASRPGQVVLGQVTPLAVSSRKTLLLIYKFALEVFGDANIANFLCSEDINLCDQLVICSNTTATFCDSPLPATYYSTMEDTYH